MPRLLRLSGALLAGALIAPIAAGAVIRDRAADGPNDPPTPLPFRSPGGVVAHGEIVPGDVDYFSVPVVAGEPLTVAVSEPDGGVFADPVLGVFFEGDASPGLTDDDDGPGFLPALRVVVPSGTGSTWRIAVSGFGDAAFVGDHQERFAYKLVVSKPPPSTSESDESSNDTTPEPVGAGGFDVAAPGGALVVSGQLVAATSASAGDVDRYAFPVEPGRDLLVAVFEDDEGAFADPVVVLSAPPSQPQGQDDDDGPGFLAGLVTETATAVPSGQSWTVEVTRFRNEPGNDADEPYELVLAATGRPCDANGDRVVDEGDIGQIFAARGQPASGVADLRDLDQDLTVTVADSRACVFECDNPDCSPPVATTTACGLLGIEALLPLLVLRRRRRRRARTAALVMLAVVCASPARAASLALETLASTIALGDALVVDVVLSDLGGAEVGAYDLDVAYDAAAFAFVSVSFDGVLGDPTAVPTQVFQSAAGGAGLVDLAETSLLPEAALDGLQDDPLRLARITFEAIGLGATNLDVVDDADLVVVDAGAAPIALTRPFGALAITVVPEPTTVLLLALGLVGLARRAVRRA